MMPASPSCLCLTCNSHLVSNANAFVQFQTEETEAVRILGQIVPGTLNENICSFTIVGHGWQGIFCAPQSIDPVDMWRV